MNQSQPDQIVISVSAGTGRGRTPLSAFDAALHDAGVANFNLVRLSSVIPPGADVVVRRADEQIKGGFGDLLYAVYAAAWAVETGSEAWAGLTWSRNSDGSGAGLFVEHAASSRDELQSLLDDTLEDLGARRAGDFVKENHLLSMATCIQEPVCALVLASYRTRGWGV